MSPCGEQKIGNEKVMPGKEWTGSSPVTLRWTMGGASATRGCDEAAMVSENQIVSATRRLRLDTGDHPKMRLLSRI
jgi:hypothetical protein